MRVDFAFLHLKISDELEGTGGLHNWLGVAKAACLKVFAGESAAAVRDGKRRVQEDL